jgi:DNA-binding beta-propeller fold protein YncE
VTTRLAPHRLLVPLCSAALAACATAPRSDAQPPAAAAGRPIAVVTGLTAPEAVRYDPDQDVYFVSNFGSGDSDVKDDNGFISRVRPDGTIEAMRWAAGGAAGVTLHAPRGMAIAGDTLWVADADAVRGFNRRTGAAVASVAFPGHTLGFLNDVAAAPDGSLRVTDTGTDRVYRIAGRAVTVASREASLGKPNGITWDAANARFLVVPYGGGQEVRALAPGGGALTTVATAGGAQIDGVEVLAGGRLLLATQSDSSLHLITGGRDSAIVRTPGKPADIGVDTKRNRVAVPYIALNRVEIYQLPASAASAAP